MVYCKINTSRFQQKINHLNREIPKVIVQVVDEEIRLLKQEVEQYLDRVIGLGNTTDRTDSRADLIRELVLIKQSLETGHISPELAYLMPDSQVAPNNALIHDGCKTRKPVHYMSDTIAVKRAEIFQRMRTKILTEIRRIGRN